MNRMVTYIALLAVAALVIPAAAQSQGGQWRTGSQQPSQQPMTGQDWQSQQRQPSMSQPQSQQVSGQITDVRQVDIRQSGEDHVLAKIRTDDGQSAVVDLGPVSQVRRSNLQLARGQTIQASGSMGRINDKPILMASRVRQNGQTVTLGTGMERQPGQDQQWGYQPQDTRGQYPRDSGQMQDQSMGRMAPGQHMVQGRLSDVRDVQLRGVSDRHRLIRLQTDQGRTVVVDLGSQQQLQGLNLRRNDMIVVSGSMGRINGQPVLFADRVGTFMDIRRTDRPTGQGGQQFQDDSMQQQQQQQPTDRMQQPWQQPSDQQQPSDRTQQPWQQPSEPMQQQRPQQQPGQTQGSGQQTQ